MHSFDKSCLVLGGARSGKSRFAEELAQARPGRLIYIATAEARDAEMRARIDAHRARRGERWTTREVTVELAEALREADDEDVVVLVDCLTLWLANATERGRNIEAESDRLCRRLVLMRGAVVLVSNEVGLGLVPTTPLGRQFRDAAGRLNQHMAAAVDTAYFVAAGLPLELKGRG